MGNKFNFFEEPLPYRKDMCDNVSEMLVRANPKLSTNVKIMTNEDFVMLESFNACKEISVSKFKNVNTYSTSKYNSDISRFWKSASKQQAFCVFQEFDNTTVKETFSKQYETFYWSGCEYIDSLEYEEQYGILAPLWLESKIPEKFVIFRIADPSYWNALKKEEARELDFVKDILDKCEIVRTFDLSENTKIGSYIRRYYNQDGFPSSPITMNDSYISFNGISYDNGEFVSVKETYDERFWQHDETVIEFDKYITSGFERNGIILANILNIEFLFDDTKSKEYEFARYFGLYCNTIEDGTFEITKDSLFNKGNTYCFDINDFHRIDKPLVVENDKGINIPAQNVTNTDCKPSYDIVSKIQGIFCIEDIKGQLHSISRTMESYHDSENDLAFRLCETKSDLNLFKGFVKDIESVSCIYEDNITPSSVFCKITDEIPQYVKIMLYNDGKLISELTSVSEKDTLKPGEYDYDMFCGSGSASDIAKAIAGSFNAVNDIGIKAYYSNDYVYFISMNAATTYNKYLLKTDKENDRITWSNEGRFEGSNTFEHIKCKESDMGSFKIGKYVPSRLDNGYCKITAIITDFDNATKNNGELIFNNGKYYDILFDRKGVYVPRTNQISVYKDYKPAYCRLSFFPVKDMEMSTYHKITKYGDMGELEYELSGATNTHITIGKQKNNSSTISKVIKVDGMDITLNIDCDENIYINDISDSDYAVKSLGNNKYRITVNPMIHNANYITPEQLSLKKSFNFDTLSTTLNVPALKYLTSEYDRCYENLNPNFMTESKTQPWICNWVMRNGLDVREKPYRLNNNPVFGQYSFSPDVNSNNPDTICYNQEWDYIMDVPMEYAAGNTKELANQRNIFSYIGCEIDNIEEFENNLRDTEYNWFDTYFKRDAIQVDESFFSTPDYMLKYSLLHGGSDNTNSETFFRGTKIEFLMKSDWSEKIDNNLNGLKLKYGKDMNGYKFTAVCVPLSITDGSPIKENKLKIIRNDVFKTITLICYIVKYYDDALELLFGIEPQHKITLGNISRYLLYNSTKDDSVNHEFKPISVKGYGTVSFNVSTENKDVIVVTGKDTNFLTDFELYNHKDTYYETDKGDKVTYNKEMLLMYNLKNIDSNPNSVVCFGIKIDRIESDNKLYGHIIDVNYENYDKSIYYSISKSKKSSVLKNKIPTEFINREMSYFIVNCNYNQFAKNINNNVFGNVLYKVNTKQDGNIIYELVDNDGKFITSESGEYPYAIRFINPLNKAKYEYISLSFDGEYVTYNIKPSHAAPMYRHTGEFVPLKNNVLYYTDPYIQDFTKNKEYEKDAKYKLFTESRHMNTCFDTTVSDFGQIHDLAFHRVNENNQNVFNLTDGQKPIFPTTNRFAIGYRDINVFNSSWDPFYFTRTESNTLEVDCHGTLSMKENKSFFGSKCISMPERYIFDIFTYNEMDDNNKHHEDVLYSIKDSHIEMYVNVEQIIINKIVSDIKPLFEKYIDSKYSYGDKSTVTDDIEEYVKSNLLKLYQLSDIKLCLKTESYPERKIDFSGLSMNSIQKKQNGLDISNIMGISSVQGSTFDKKIVINTKTGVKYTIGLKLEITKK